MDLDLMKKWLQKGNTTLPNILLQHYKDIGLTNDDLVILLHLKSFVDSGESFPDSQALGDRLHLSNQEAFKYIHDLMNKKVISIETIVNSEGKSQDMISFDLLWEKLFYYLKQKDTDEKIKEETIQAKDLYQMFEDEFGRELSPIEFQKMNGWIDEDKYSPDLIQLALREAVLNQAYNLNYIDRILLNWERKNIRTKEQVEKESLKYRENQSKKDKNTQIGQPDKPVPMHNWLKGLKKDDN